MSLTMGPNTGLLINGAPGEGHHNELMRLLRWDDFLRQPVVKGRVATLPTSGQVEGDIYIFTGAGANQNRLARWWATGATTAIWEYMPPRLGWRVQVANETTPSGQVKTCEYSGTAWVELVGGMSDAPSDGKRVCPRKRRLGGAGVGREIGAQRSAVHELDARYGAFRRNRSQSAEYDVHNVMDSKHLHQWLERRQPCRRGQVRLRQQHKWWGRAGAQCAGASTAGCDGPHQDIRFKVRGRVLHDSAGQRGHRTTTGSAGADGVTRYLCRSNGSKTVFNAGAWATVVMWLRVESGSAHISSAPYTTHKLLINGAVAAPGVVLPANQWVHLRFSMQSYNGW
ncbi:DUF2793 domain-containing protein [Pseudomonas aeruginosa]|nr:DUF2793 domain-containing protein [Pseudomonas aeruginosa]